MVPITSLPHELASATWSNNNEEVLTVTEEHGENGIIEAIENELAANKPVIVVIDKQTMKCMVLVPSPNEDSEDNENFYCLDSSNSETTISKKDLLNLMKPHYGKVKTFFNKWFQYMGHQKKFNYSILTKENMGND